MISGQVANEYSADDCVMPVSLEMEFMRLHSSLNAHEAGMMRTQYVLLLKIEPCQLYSFFEN